MGELGEEFFEDVDILDVVEDEFIEEEIIELTEEEIKELEQEMERDVKKLEYEEEIEIFLNSFLFRKINFFLISLSIFLCSKYLLAGLLFSIIIFLIK